MKAQKVTVTITIEALSIDVHRSLLSKVQHLIDDEVESGELMADDGDTIKWVTTRKPVEF